MGRCRKSQKAIAHEKRAQEALALVARAPIALRDPAPTLDPRRAAAFAVARQTTERTRRGALGLASVTGLAAVLLAALRQPPHVVGLVAVGGGALSFALWLSARRAQRRLAPPPPARNLLPFEFDDDAYSALLDARPLSSRVRACVVFREHLHPDDAALVERELWRRCGEEAVTRFESRRLYVEAPPFALAQEGERPSQAIEAWTRFVVREGLLSIHEHHPIERVRVEAVS